jgi:cobalamin biosynthesis Mg chelatase CobN
MRNRIVFIVSLLVAALLLAVTAWAHSGRTDSRGGHTNHSTGEYHYHHGYSAHQHPNGVCPYDSDDETNEPSSDSKNKIESNKNTTTQAKPNVVTSKTSSSNGTDTGWVGYLVVGLCVGGIFIALRIRNKNK